VDSKLLAQLAKALYEYERGHPFPEHYGSLLHVYVGRVEVWLDGGRAVRDGAQVFR
jgi:hypothetical protein